MIYQIKEILGKLYLGLKILSSFVFASVLLSLLAPFLLDKFSPLIAFKTEVGFRIVKETLLYSHTFIGLILAAILLVMAYFLYQLTEYVDRFYQNIDRMSLKELNLTQFQGNLNTTLNAFNDEVKNIQLKEEKRISNLKEKTNEILKHHYDLSSSIIEIESITKETTAMFDEFEKVLGRGHQDNIIYQTGQKFNTISENIFKIQLHVFSISVESFRDTVAGPEKLSTIAKDLECLIGTSTTVIEEVTRTLEEYEDSKTRNKKEIIEKLIEAGRHFGKLTFLTQNFWLAYEKLGQELYEFKNEIDKSSPEVLSIMRESEAESLKILFKDIFYKTDFVVKSLEEMIKSPIDFLKSEESEEKVKPVDVPVQEVAIEKKEEKKEEKEEELQALPDNIPVVFQNWNKDKKAQEEELVIEADDLCNQADIDEVARQNQLALMSIMPKHLIEEMR